MAYDKLMYGKDEITKVVSVCIKGNNAHIYREVDGKIEEIVRDMNYWIVSNTMHGDGWIHLDGYNHYNYIKYYNTPKDFYEAKRLARQYYADIWTIANGTESFLVKEGVTYYKDLLIKDVSTLSFDIEATGLTHDDEARVLLISNTFRKGDETIKKVFKYDDYSSQGEFIKSWCDWVREVNPSIILGYNIMGYDLPYLTYCAEQDGYELILGRDDSPLKYDKFESKFRKDGSQSYNYRNASIFGRELVDVMFLTMGWDTIHKKLTSYALKTVIRDLGMEKEDRQHYDASKIKDNYQDPEEWKKIIAYAQDDSDDSLVLFDKISPAFFYLCRAIPKPFQKICNSCTNTGSQVNSFLIRSYLQDNKAIPKASETRHIRGAVSYGVPGLHKNVFKVDLASLYPSIMRQWNVFNKAKDPEGNMIKALEQFTDERLKNKQLAKDTGESYYKDLEQSTKVYLNSNYGMLNCTGLNFNSPDDGEFVTKKGQEILTKSILWATGKTVYDWGYTDVADREE